MNDQEARSVLENALSKLASSDLPTFGNTIGERPIMFRIALYMARHVEEFGLTVDCDYNRHGSDIKELPSKDSVDFPDKRFFPDIVVHERKVDTKNVLVCEVKKVGGSPSADDVDRERLRLLTSCSGSFKYRLGAFVIVDQANCHVKVEYFSDGVANGQQWPI